MNDEKDFSDVLREFILSKNHNEDPEVQISFDDFADKFILCCMYICLILSTLIGVLLSIYAIYCLIHLIIHL